MARTVISFQTRLGTPIGQRIRAVFQTFHQKLYGKGAGDGLYTSVEFRQFIEFCFRVWPLVTSSCTKRFRKRSRFRNSNVFRKIAQHRPRVNHRDISVASIRSQTSRSIRSEFKILFLKFIFV